MWRTRGKMVSVWVRVEFAAEVMSGHVETPRVHNVVPFSPCTRTIRCVGPSDAIFNFAPLQSPVLANGLDSVEVAPRADALWQISCQVCAVNAVECRWPHRFGRIWHRSRLTGSDSEAATQDRRDGGRRSRSIRSMPLFPKIEFHSPQRSVFFGETRSCRAQEGWP